MYFLFNGKERTWTDKIAKKSSCKNIVIREKEKYYPLSHFRKKQHWAGVRVFNLARQ